MTCFAVTPSMVIMGQSPNRGSANRASYAAKMFFAAALLLSATGCASVATGQMKEVKAFNRIFLHENPRAGDYALYGNEDGSHLMKREIIGVRGDVVEIQTTFPKTATIIAYLQNISFHSHARMDGTVLDAHMLDARSGEKTPLAIAGPGDYNYIDERSVMTLPLPETITTKAGTYRTDKVIVFNQSIEFPGVQTKVTSVWYFDPKVKFGLVRQHDLVESDASIVEVAAFINKLSPAPQLYRSLNSYIIEKARHHTYTSRLDLVETN